MRSWRADTGRPPAERIEFFASLTGLRIVREELEGVRKASKGRKVKREVSEANSPSRRLNSSQQGESRPLVPDYVANLF